MTRPWETPLGGPAAAVAARIAAAIPEVSTERLVLRAPRISDFEAYAAIFTSDRAAYMDGPYDREGAWGDFTQAVAGWVLRGTGVWTVTLRDGGDVLGFLYLWQEYGDPEPEVGWALVEAAEGKGYAYEAARAVLPLGLAQFGPGGVVSYIDAGNAASARLAARLGGRRDPAAETRLGDADCHVWRYAAEGAE